MPTESSEVIDYRAENIPLLEEIFGEELVEEKWDVATNSEDSYDRDLYCPEVDIAVGPFNTSGDINHNLDRIEEYYNQNESLINRFFFRRL